MEMKFGLCIFILASEKVTFYLTIEGKKMIIKINWILVATTTIFGCLGFDFEFGFELMD